MRLPKRSSLLISKQYQYKTLGIGGGNDLKKKKGGIYFPFFVFHSIYL
jgi:hypothetical protein